MRASRFAFILAVPGALFVACGGGDLVPSDSGPAGSGGTTSSGGTVASSGGTATTGGSASTGGLGGTNLGGEAGSDGTGGTDTDGCHPRVHLLIQRSGAMFQSPAAEDNWWDAVADALDGDGALLEEFQGQLELSASVFSKYDGAESCPVGAAVSSPIGAGDLEDVLNDEKDDFEEISANVNVDAPIVEAVEAGTALLVGEGKANAYILLIASDLPDTCESSNNQCNAESVFAAVQGAHGADVQTRLLYLTSSATLPGYPEGVANAGNGEGIADLNLGCGTGFEYSATPGTAPFQTPPDTASVEQALRDLMTGIASCN